MDRSVEQFPEKQKTSSISLMFHMSSILSYECDLIKNIENL